MRAFLPIVALALWAAGPARADGGYARLEGHGGPVMDAAISPGGSHALTASFDNSVGYWALDDPEPRWLDGHEAAVNTAIFIGEDRALSAGDDYDAILWDLSSSELLHRLEGHTSKILGVAASGTLAATASWDRTIGLWDLQTGARVGTLEGHRGPVQAVVFSGDGKRLYSASTDGTIRLWDVEAQEFKRVEASHGFGVNKLALNEAAGWLAYGALDGGVRILDLDSGEEVADVTSGRRPVLALTLSPDGTRLAIGDGEGFIHIIDTADWSTVRDFRAVPRGPVWALAFDGTERILAGTINDHADLWPIATVASVEEDAGALRSFQRDPATMSNGERQFARKCSICHTLTLDGGRRAGPSLHGVFGRRAGSLDGYIYSDALTGSDLVWSAETLDKLFDLGPDHYTPGSKMPMQRIVRAEDRADLIAYLKQATEASPEEKK